MGAFSNSLQRHNKVKWWEAVTGQIQPPNKMQLSKCKPLLGHIFSQICLPPEQKRLAGEEMGHCKGPWGGEERVFP